MAYKTDDLDLLRKRISDLYRTSENRYCYTSTGFLSLAEQDAAVRYLTGEHLYDYRLYGGQDGSERKICIFGNEETFGYPFDIPICIIKIEPSSIKFAETLSHRDYLGAILNLRIDRSTTGDIIIRDKVAWLYCLDTISDFICSSLTKVNHTSVHCSVADTPPPELILKLQEHAINVASMRLDAVIAAVTKDSRSKASALIKYECVFINGLAVTKDSHLLKDGDIVAVRGFGKFIFNGILNKTKKDRFYISVGLYT